MKKLLDLLVLLAVAIVAALSLGIGRGDRPPRETRREGERECR